MIIPRARSHEGGTLTIRIPRQMSDKSGAPILTQPLISPSPAASHHPRIVGKSKSLTTSMDKLASSGGRAPSRNSSSRESSFAGSSRGSTPISGRSAVAPRPPSRRSVQSTRSPQPAECHTIDLQERAAKSGSPTGSDVSLHSSQSINSSTQSVNSSQSIHSAASSNASVKSKTSGRSYIPGRPRIPQCPRASSEPPTLSPSHSKSPSKRVSKSGSTVAAADPSSESRKGHLPSRRRSTSASLNSSSGDVRSNETSSPRNMSTKYTPPRANPPPSQNSSNIKPSIGTMSNRKPLRVFNSYMSLFQVQEKLKKGEVIEGVLRINPKSYEDAYISAPEGGMDIFIGGVRDRNTALHGDIVAAMLNHPQEWKILYPQLEAYLKEHSDLKALVYMPLKPDISNADNAFTTTTILSPTTVRSHSTTSKSEKVTKNEEESPKPQSKEMPKKKKKHRRGKKKQDKDPCSRLALAAEGSCSGPSKPVKDPFKVVADAPVPLIPPQSPDMQGVMVVAPHQLSECELSDNESCHSLASSMENLLSLQDPSTSNIPPNAVSTICPQMELSTSDPFIKKDPHPKKIKVQKQKVIDKDPCISPSEQVFGTPECHLKELYQSEYKNREGRQAGDDCIKTSAKSDPNQGLVKETPSLAKPSVLQVQRLTDWKKFVQRTAVVVNILERKHPMVAAGIIKLFADKNPHFALFSPFDPRVPRIKIQMHKCPPEFLSRPTDYTRKIFLARITEWNDPKFAFGDLVHNIGEVGDINAELESLLLENNIDSSDFPPSVYDSLPKLPWSIPQEELKYRTDLRNSTIFTIDPPSARDLDDALSCLPLPSGNFRVGVHIADVTYFVAPNTPLDDIASDRGNSFYLVHKVIPMLPSILCEKLCSLNPGEERLTFSIIWELTPEGVIKDEWVGRTIIRSCAKFSYDNVQEMIKSPNREFSPEDLPSIVGVSIAEVVTTVNNLNKIAIKLRKHRIADGALRLDQVKLGFTLPPDSLTPTGIYVQEIKESNKLVEEFMLMANIEVARRIYRAFPKLAFLRRHPPPHDTQMDAVVTLLGAYGVHLSSESSKMLSQSIESYVGSDPLSVARMQLIINLCSKPMHYALYICAGQGTSTDFHHYALNIPFYTHFTSPIRRYADIIVHRLLAASLDPVRYPFPPWDVPTLARRAEICNDKKQASKIIQEVNCELFLALFIRNAGEMVERAIIIGVLDRSIDVMICKFGIIKRCYMEKLPLVSSHFLEENDRKSLIIEWEGDESAKLPKLTQTLSYFGCVTVVLRPFENEALKFNAFLVRPDRSID